MTNMNDELVVGLYDSADGARGASESVRKWDSANKAVKLGAIAVITYDHDKEELIYEEVGQTNTKTFAGWGTVIGATVGILSGGLGVVPGMVIGAAAGGALGAFNHKSLGMTDEQHAKLIQALKDGGAALGVMADGFEVQPVIDELAHTGGDINHYLLDMGAASTLTSAAAAQATASQAIDGTAEELTIAETLHRVALEEKGLDPDSYDAINKLVAVTGMSIDEATAFYNAGIEQPSGVLEVAALPEGRAAISEASGLDPDVVLYYAKKLDLMRVDGIGAKYSALLLASGVDTVPELGTRNATNLAKKMAEVNEAEAIVDELPAEEQVSDWVAQAKELPRMVYY